MVRGWLSVPVMAIRLVMAGYPITHKLGALLENEAGTWESLQFEADFEFVDAPRDVYPESLSCNKTTNLGW